MGGGGEGEAAGGGGGDGGLLAKKMARQIAERKKREEVPFQTKAMREIERLQKATVYRTTVIKVRCSAMQCSALRAKSLRGRGAHTVSRRCDAVETPVLCLLCVIVRVSLVGGWKFGLYPFIALFADAAGDFFYFTYGRVRRVFFVFCAFVADCCSGPVGLGTVKTR